MSPARCVVFDMDDTLYLERDYARSGFFALAPFTLERWDLPDFGERAWALFCEGARGNIFDRVLQGAGRPADADAVRMLVERYRDHRPEIALLPDARACLDLLRSRDVRMAAISDGPLQSQRAKAEVLSLAEWMSPVLLTAELGAGAGKPSPMAYQRVQETLQVAGSDCVYVADNPAKDFIAPRQLGWRTVRIRRPQSLHQNVASGADVDVEFVDLSALAGWLGVSP